MKARATKLTKPLAAPLDGRNEEHFLIRYLPGQEAEVLRAIGLWASNPEVSLTWYDAAVWSDAIRNHQGRNPPCLNPRI